jgi:hypothetical protein
MGLVYFIQPAELIGTDRYKIGRTAKNDLSRIRSYKNGSRYLFIMECEDDVNLEKALIAKFNEKFSKLAGNEYFRGNESDMFNTFLDTIREYNNKIIDDKLKIPEQEKIKTMFDKFRFCSNK